jgi:hydrogenase-4 component E
MTSTPSVYEGLANAVAVVVLLIEFGMLRSAMLRSQVRLYAVQSLAVSVLAVVVALDRGVPELYALAAVSLLFKVVLVPVVVLRLLGSGDTDIAGSGSLSVATEILLAIVVAGFGIFTTQRYQLTSPTLPQPALGIAVAVILVAFVLMIVRNDVISQAVGFFSLENGVSLASLVVAAGLPLILEVAFLFDLLVAVVVFGVLMRVHAGRTATLSTVGLNRLRG